MTEPRRKYLLAFDCATGPISAALARDGKIISCDKSNEERAESEMLLPMLHRLLKNEGKSPSDIGGILMTIGPGSFTGLRISCAIGQAIKATLGIDAFTIPAPLAISLNSGLSEGRLRVVQNAYKGEVYIADYSFSSGKPALETEIRISTPEGCLKTLDKSQMLIGFGVEKLRQQFTDFDWEGRIKPGSGHPEAAVMLEAFLEGTINPAPVETVLPFYIRPPEAELNYARKHGMPTT